jgi:hypothetical protein
MRARSFALTAGRVVAVIVAIAVLLLTPAIIESPTGRTFEPVGIAIDVVALIVLIAVAWSTFGSRFRKPA